MFKKIKDIVEKKISIGKILISIGLISLFVSTINFYNFLQYKSWIETDAKILSIRTDKYKNKTNGDGKGLYYIDIKYEYTYSNKHNIVKEKFDFDYKNFGSYILDKDEGENVKVYINPDNHSQSLIKLPDEGNTIMYIFISVGILTLTLGVLILNYISEKILIVSKHKNIKTTIIFGFTFQKAILIGLLFVGTSLYALCKILFPLFQNNNFPNFSPVIFFLLIPLIFLLLGLIPITSFNKLIINTQLMTIHPCSSIYNIFNDMSPTSFENFESIKLKTKDRKSSAEGLSHSKFTYTEHQYDLVLISNSQRKNLLIKNIGSEEKAIKIGQIISSLSGLPFNI